MLGPLTQSPPPDSLFARARAEDPVTSKLAAQVMNDTGAAADHAAIVFDVLSDHPDSTYRELSRHIIGMDHTEVMRRLNTLERRGLAVKSGSRICAVQGRLMTTWRAA